MQKHTSTLTIPVNNGKGGNSHDHYNQPREGENQHRNAKIRQSNNHNNFIDRYAEQYPGDDGNRSSYKDTSGRPRVIKDEILSCEIDRMNAKIKELHENFDDLTTSKVKPTNQNGGAIASGRKDLNNSNTSTSGFYSSNGHGRGNENKNTQLHHDSSAEENNGNSFTNNHHHSRIGTKDYYRNGFNNSTKHQNCNIDIDHSSISNKNLVSNNGITGSSNGINKNNEERSRYSTMPSSSNNDYNTNSKANLSTPGRGGGTRAGEDTHRSYLSDDPKDNFDKEIANFRQNFEEFKRNTTAPGTGYSTIRDNDKLFDRGVITSDSGATHTYPKTPGNRNVVKSNNPDAHNFSTHRDNGTRQDNDNNDNGARYKQRPSDDRFEMQSALSPSSTIDRGMMHENHAIKENAAGQKMYQISLNMQEFRSQDIKVKIIDGKVLRVEAKAETKTPNGGTIQKEFNREFTIPPHVDVEGLVSRIDSNGTMTLEAPVVGIDGRGNNGNDVNLVDSSSKTHTSSSRSFGATRNDFFNDHRTEGSPQKSIFQKIRDEFEDWTPFSGHGANDDNRRKLSWNEGGSLKNVNDKRQNHNRRNDMSRPGDIVEENHLFTQNYNPSKNYSNTIGPNTTKDWADTFRSSNHHQKASASNLVPLTDVAEQIGSRHSPSQGLKLGVLAGVDEPPFKLTFDLSGFTAEEIKVNVCDNSNLRVTARHESKSAHESVSREFNREYTLPGYVNPDTITSSLSRDGILTIESTEATKAVTGTKTFDRSNHHRNETSLTSSSEFLAAHDESSLRFPRRPNTNNVDDLPRRLFIDDMPPRRLPAPPRSGQVADSHSNPLLNRGGIRRLDEKANEDQQPHQFTLTFDMKDYEPDDIKIKILGDTLRIEAKHAEDSPARGSVIREFSREFIIPRGVQHEKLSSSFSNTGILTVQAPLRPI